MNVWIETQRLFNFATSFRLWLALVTLVCPRWSLLGSLTGYLSIIPYNRFIFFLYEYSSINHAGGTTLYLIYVIVSRQSFALYRLPWIPDSDASMTSANTSTFDRCQCTCSHVHLAISFVKVSLHFCILLIQWSCGMGNYHMEKQASADIIDLTHVI